MKVLLLAALCALVAGSAFAGPMSADRRAIDLILRAVPIYSCGGKTKCAQMDSCEEAYYYLRKCGLTRLDRDRDGVPCESICG